jgi:hypothetical protein
MMNRRIITLIILVTVIIGVVAFTTLKKEPSIEQVLITDNKDVSPSVDISENEDEVQFTGDSEIYTILFLKDIAIGNTIDLQWKRVEAGQEVLVQRDNFTEKEEGSGILIVSLAKINNGHLPGIYKIYVRLNELDYLEKKFDIKDKV